MKSTTLFLFLGCSLTMGELALATPAKKVIAGPESTVYGIAYENGITTRALISANNIKPPYVLQNGQELIIPSPNEHVVGQGESLKSIADNYGVDVDVLANENDISVVRQGEALAIPSRDTQSVTQALRPTAGPIATSSLDPLPTVKSTPRSPTRESIASSTLPTDLAEEIAREKGIKVEKAPTPLEDKDSKPVLMGNLTQRNAGAPTAATTTVRAEDEVAVVEKPKKKEKLAENKEKKAKAEKPKEKETAKKVQSEATESAAEVKELQFSKPVEFTDAEIFKKFKAGTNDGVKIKVPEGTAVKAAAAGDVLYAGSELAGYGNLVLLKHKGGWVTAYAYNSSLLVKKGDAVKKGQTIAKSGKTGDAKEPLLHFEVRKGKQAVDPLPKIGA